MGEVAAKEERWSLGDVLGTSDVPSEAAKSHVELCTNESTALMEKRCGTRGFFLCKILTCGRGVGSWFIFNVGCCRV